MAQENKQDAARIEYLCELIATQDENLAKNLRELADIYERCGCTPKPLATFRRLADTVDAVRSLTDKVRRSLSPTKGR